MSDWIDRITELHQVLRGVACRTDGDGKPCWCLTDARDGSFVAEHAGYCRNARAALRGEVRGEEIRGSPSYDVDWNGSGRSREFYGA